MASQKQNFAFGSLLIPFDTPPFLDYNEIWRSQWVKLSIASGDPEILMSS